VEAVAFGVIRAPLRDGRDQALDLGRVHLAVAVELDTMSAPSARAAR
jgi:hypothetical protein